MILDGRIELGSLDRQLARAHAALERSFASLETEQGREAAHITDPFDGVREVSGQTTFNALRKLEPGASDVAHRDALVRWVHELLQTEFGLPDGLADNATWGDMADRHPGLTLPEGVTPTDRFVTVLDPATGTGTFLVEAIEVIHRTLKKFERDGLVYANDGDWVESLTALVEESDGGLRLLTHGGEVLATLAPREPWRLPIGRVA